MQGPPVLGREKVMQYQYLNSDQKRQMIESRLQQYEAEHFGHSLNLVVAQAQSEDDPTRATSIEQTQASLETLERAITAARGELAEIPEEG